MISAVILTKNEEKNIGACLATLKWCDELVVTDDESWDKTCEIAQKLGAKVFSHPLNNDFAAQRNFGLKKASGDWVIFVDADERVEDSLAGEIMVAIKKPNFSGFIVKRRDFMFRCWLEHGETGNTKLLRLGRKGSGEWIRSVHEIWDISGNIGQLQFPLLHWPHPTVAEFLKKINLYTTLDAEEFYRQGRKVGVGSIIFYPVGKFFLNYVIKLGFLDGMAGFLMAIIMSFHSFLTRGKLWQLQHRVNSQV
ncbi:MAG: glycosyltransferase family 2 protein [bacterium]|nr:glycosyltransferase family 2 protein [bacterium]